MASSARIFFAGVGTTFVILGVGFGGGLLMAKSALKEPTGYQARATAQPPSPARVILPASAEAAQPPQPLQQVAATEPAPEPVKESRKSVLRRSISRRLKRKRASDENVTRNAKRREKPSVLDNNWKHVQMLLPSWLLAERTPRAWHYSATRLPIPSRSAPDAGA